jgi:predicted TIM-barrel fold metal-dependent hydrolase
MAPSVIIDTLSEAIIFIARQCFSGDLASGEAAQRIKRAQRLAQAERLGVPVVAVTDQDLVAARIALPPQASRPLTDEERRRVEAGLYLEEWRR